MSPEKQRIAIAKACPDLGWWKDREGAWHFKDGVKMRNGDPLKDLNAMHEVEQTLEVGFDGSQMDDYQQTLWGIVNKSIPFQPETLHDVAYLAAFMSATAAQRGEAFVRTLNLWEDEKPDTYAAIPGR